MKISCSFRHSLWGRFFLLPRMKDVLGTLMFIQFNRMCDHNRTKIRDGPLENLSEGKGGGRITKKKIFAQGEIKRKKNSCAPINPKKYLCYGLKKNYTRNLITKKFLRLENSFPPPPSPHNFSKGPSPSSGQI